MDPNWRRHASDLFLPVLPGMTLVTVSLLLSMTGSGVVLGTVAVFRMEPTEPLIWTWILWVSAVPAETHAVMQVTLCWGEP